MTYIIVKFYRNLLFDLLTCTNKHVIIHSWPKNLKRDMYDSLYFSGTVIYSDKSIQKYEIFKKYSTCYIVCNVILISCGYTNPLYHCCTWLNNQTNKMPIFYIQCKYHSSDVQLYFAIIKTKHLSKFLQILRC